MNKTTKLSEVYCEPQTEAEWESLDNPVFLKGGPDDDNTGQYVEEYYFMDDGSRILISSNGVENKTKKKATVLEFIQLWEDKIAPWRMLELGFKHCEGVNGYVYTVHGGMIWYKPGVALQLAVNGVDINLNADTFTELVNFMKVLTK